ncbi:hypothetical protein [Vibrio parahaemolyticus]|uniref:hypothetical protein n=1 Tax=Vibrio parahaemolyticus TaxID=670 RepID=UPI0004A48634|nr:hypothetical protein [Vibrio parahaemolyticus]HCE5184935.1 hypothetical protein [Vibrio parahaemolyticus]
MKAETKKTGKVGKPATVKPQSPNLVSTWRMVVTRSGGSLTEALAVMNGALGMKLTHSRIAQWEKDEKAPSNTVINYMLATVIPALLVELGHSDAKARDISSKVRIPGL